MLRWARERAGKDVEGLRRQFPKLEDWEAERVKPTLKQLEAYARATYAPFGFFFLEEPPEETFPIPFFRTAETAAPRRPSPNLLDTVQAMQRRQDWLSEFLARDGEPRVPFVGSARVGEPTAPLAARMRETLGFTLGWARQVSTWEAALTTLRDAMDAAGVLVVTNGVVGNNTHRKLDTGEFRGFVLVDDYAPLVFVNGADAKGAQLFTLVHELAHIWFGRSAAFDLKDMQPAADVIEQTCNAVAAEFLVPEVELRAQWTGVAENTATRFDTFVGGDLRDWALTSMPGDCFCTTDEQDVLAAYQEGVQWVMAQDFTDAAKAEYARDGNADAWVIAFAKACGASVATEEKLNLAKKNKVPIPNVCEALGVPYVDTFEMLRTLQARFSWQQP